MVRGDNGHAGAPIQTSDPALRGSLSHYTVYTPRGAAPGSLTIVPDASGSLVGRLVAGETLRTETWFWGPSSRAVVVERNPETCPLYIMVEFLPCGAHSLFHLPMHELHNAILPLAVLDYALHTTLVSCLEHRMECPQDMASVWALLDSAFLRLHATGDDSRLARQVISEMQWTHGTLRVDELSRHLGCSSRQLARVMAERLGMPTKSLARIIRINAACRRMDAASVSLTELAHSLHYHDQSHFIRDFADICGVTPGDYCARRSHFYNEDLKLGAIVPGT